MTRSYHLGLVGRPNAGGLAESRLSTEVFYQLLTNQFSKLGHVRLTHHRTDEPLPDDLPDVFLVHDYLYLAEQFLRAARWAGAVTASWMEISYKYATRAFCFLPEAAHLHRSVVIPFPYDDANMAVCPKERGSILVDHAWPGFPAGSRWDDTTRVMSVVRELGGPYARVAQCARQESSPLSVGGFEQVGLQPYLGYLEATVPFETFIVTHHGSYNGAIVDMAARGARIVARTGYTRPSQVSAMNIQTYNTTDELRGILTSEAPPPVRPASLTPLSKATQIMDGHFQELIG